MFLFRRLLCLCGLTVLARPELSWAQTVMEVQGGGSSLTGGYGATANFWRTGVDGWIGLGYLDGLRVGAFLRKTMNRDTLRVGNDALVMRLPTDIFSSGLELLVQGMSYSSGDARMSYLAFGGASSTGRASQSFQPTSIDAPMGALFLQRRLTPTLRLTANTIFADRQTVLPGIQWQPTPDVTAALAGGLGSNQPYGASSVILRQGRVEAKASYAWNSDGFRRVSVPVPNQTEIDRENLMVTYAVSSEFSIGASRQNFVQDSAGSPAPVRATGNSVFAGGQWSDFRLAGGLYDSRSQGIGNLSSYVAVGRELSPWLDAEIFLLQSRPEGLPATTTPLANLRWRVSSRLGLTQQVSLHDGHPTVLFGASLATPIGEFSADYQIVHQPFQPFNPFRSALNLTARLQLGSYSTSIGTFVQPDGSVDYAASGSTFLYMGSFGGVQPQALGGARMARYIIRGTVRDDLGNPVEGAAVQFGDEIVFTNSAGVFLLRVKRPSRYRVAVLPTEFLLPGQWEVVSAPTDIVAADESRAGPVEIILRHSTESAHVQ
jgi:hypothetical protein